MNPPPLVTVVPPLLPPARPQLSVIQTALSLLLSIFLGLFLADAVVSLLDDSLIVIGNVHLLGLIRGLLAFLVFLMSVVIYGLMGLTPMIPKRLFLPLTLFGPVTLLVIIPFLIYFYGRLQLLAWLISLLQVGVGLLVLHRVRGGLRLRWPLVAGERITARRFSWRNLVVFLLANVLVLLPGALIYFFICATVAVDHFTDGFVGLRPYGLTVEARKYVREDGKTVELFPMAHVAERSFYRALSASFTSNSVILMEGVFDENGLLTNQISYRRMAESIGVAEQEKEFNPVLGEIVPADLDVSQFTTNTIGFLNLIMKFYTKGLDGELLRQIISFSPPPGFERELIGDLLHKRNQHLVEELRARLPQAEQFVVPWGAAHMPEIAREIQKLGFRLDETREFKVIDFRSATKRRKGSKRAAEEANSK